MCFDRFRPQVCRRLTTLVLSLALLAVPGCGGGTDESAESAGSNAERSGDEDSRGRSRETENPRQSEASAGADDAASASELVRTDADGRKWIEDIPLDVWYDEPLATYTDNVQVTAGGPASSGATDPVDPAPSPAPDSAAPEAEPARGDPPQAAGTEWSELIAAAVLDAEAKSLRNQLTTAMQTVATYNNNFQSIQWDAATLCAAAGIAVEHPDALSWKDKAPQIRDLAQKIEEAAQERGRSAFEQTQVPFEQMIAVFSGNEPAGLEPAAPSVPFAESASRGGMMRRMQEAFDWLDKNINSAERLGDAAHQEQLVLETSLLAALTRVIASEGYPSAEEPDYGQEAQGLLQDALDARSAAQAGSYDPFREAVDRMGTRCNNCHTKYRFEE